MQYISFHNHTHFSVFDAIAKPEDLVSRAKELGMPALGISDHGTTRGLMDFYHECKKAGIKPILGVEMYYAVNLGIKDRKLTHHICLYAKNLTGYRNMLKLVTIGYENQYHNPRIDFKALTTYGEGLIVTSACMGGIFNCEDFDKIAKHFGDDFYIEVHANVLPEQKEYNLKVVDYANKHNIKVIMASDVHYVNKEDADLHRAWKGLDKENPNEYYTTDDYYLMNTNDITSRLSYLPKELISSALYNCNEIADKCEVEIPMGGMHYPEFPIENKLEAIKDICRKGWKKKVIPFHNKDRQKYVDRLMYELDVMEKANYPNYFLITHGLLSWCDSVGIRRGEGRGSVVASLVAYLMDITKLDPIEHNLVFERFLHLERVTPCDIDNDVQRSRRGEVIQRLKDEYVTVYGVGTANYVGESAAIQRAGQILKMSPSEIDSISKASKSIDDIDEKYSQLKSLAKKLVGLIQNFGVHASAVVVFPSDPTEWCAIEKSGDNFIAATDDFHHLEDQGLLKLDILGLATLDIIDEVYNEAKLKEDLDNLPLNDKPTIKMLRDGDTKGCFQIETNTATPIVKGMNVTCGTDMSHVVALGRPGPIDSGMMEEFLKRRQGLSKVEYLHPKLEPILRDTLGIIVYQEQIIEIVKEFGGYTMGQADVLRRILGRKELDKVEAAINEFKSRAISNGIQESIVNTLAEQIQTFGRYGFNKGHSAAYGYTAYQTAYLKANYPLYFWTAVINNATEDSADKVVKYLSYVRTLPNIELVFPNRNSTHKCMVLNGKIQLGFNILKNVGQSKFDFDGVNNYADFMQKNGGRNKLAISSLIKAGVFEGDRNLMLAQLDWYKDKRKSKPPLESVVATENIDYSILEKSVMGVSIKEILHKYDDTLAKEPNIICAEIIKNKPHTTKTNKPMAFINARDLEGTYDLVCFESKCNLLKEGEVYLLKLRGTQILDFTKAQLKNGA